MEVSIDVQCAAIEKTNFICDNAKVQAVKSFVGAVSAPGATAATVFDVVCQVADAILP